MTDDRRLILYPDGVEFRIVDAAEITDEMGLEMIAVFRSAFGRWPSIDPEVPAMDHLRWKTSGPFKSGLGSLQARVEGRLAYATTSWASWMRIGGRRWLRVYYPDTAVHRDFQGRRIYSRVPEYRRRMIADRRDLSMHDHHGSPRQKGPLGRQGQQFMANAVTRWYRVLRPISFSTGRDKLWLAPIAIVAAAGGGLLATTRHSSLRRSNLQPRDHDGFDDRFDRLFDEAAVSFDVILERHQDFLRWRYGDRRAGPFLVRSIVEGDRLLGYRILRVAGAKAYLCDLLALPGREDVVEALVADAVHAARAANATGVECWLSSGHPYRGALSRQGFFDSRLDVGVQYTPIDATAEDLRCLADPKARVHFLIGDTDLV